MISVATSFAVGFAAFVVCSPPPLGAVFDLDEEPIRSALHAPLFVGEAPPELRTLAAIWIPHAGLERVPEVVDRDREEAMRIAHGIVRRLREGDDWYSLAKENSASRNRDSGSVWGSFAQGVLAPDFDAFLFSASVGEFSEPVSNERGVFVLHRMETYAACRVVTLRGVDEDAWERAQEIARLARAGEDFAELAREHSSHRGSAERGGAWSIFERGPADTSIKLETFRAAVGDIVGPIEVLGSLFVLKRVPTTEIDASLADNNWIRVRALALAFDGAAPGLRPNPRDVLEAMELAMQLHERIQAGESMIELIDAHDDDPTGPERDGDLGWIHRRTPGLPRPLQTMFSTEIGELSDPTKLEVGIVILRRDA